jgi:hypothetical protein
MLALHDGDAATARVAADALLRIYGPEPVLESPEEVGRYGMSEVLAGMAAAAAGDSAAAQSHYAVAAHTLASLARDSHYWRILDPWARLSLLTGDAVEATRARALLSEQGYVPLLPWPQLVGEPPAAVGSKLTPGRPSARVPPPPRASARVRGRSTTDMPPSAVASKR